MIYKCECEKCGKIITINTDKDPIGINHRTYVTAYGYLTTPCECGGDAYAPWFSRGEQTK